MSPENDHSSILRKTPGLTNLFHANVRRSRSLASLQREEAEQPPPPQPTIATIAAMRNRGPPGAYNSFNESPVQTGLRPPPRSNKSVNSLEGHSIQLPKSRWFANPSVQENHTRTPSAPSRPKPAPRLWTEDDDEPDIKPSLLGLEPLSAVRSQPPQIMWQPPQPSSSPSNYTRNPRSPSPLTKSQSQRDRSLSRRRQPNVSELNLDSLSTVAETSNESPSFPRPRSVRNLSDPTTTPGHKNSARESLTPRAQSTDDTARTPQGTARTPYLVEPPSDSLAVTPQKAKRASSMLLPIALAPLITSSPPQLTNYTISSPEGEKPPVPPKDSIYAVLPPKAPTPRPEQGPQKAVTPRPEQEPQSTSSSVSHSAQSSLSEQDYTVASSVTTMSPVDFPNTWPVELPGKEESLSPRSQHRNESQDRSGKLPWVMKEYRAMPSRKPIGNATPKTATAAGPPKLSVENVEQFSVNDFPTLSTPDPSSTHQRNVSDSVLNRGRPTKRGNSHRPQRTISRDLRLANIAGTIDDLPDGHNKIQALTTFSQEQLFNMRREADSDASGFEVLDQRDVEKLKDEQDLLDEHCNKLRRQGLSLRQTREQLHIGFLNFLKTAGNPMVSREYVLQQATELSDMDQQIDEASTKLEAAQDRRVKVQRRLLEHVAATLALTVPGAGGLDEQTPPRSPTHSINYGPASIMIAMDSEDMMFSPPNDGIHNEDENASSEYEILDAEEREYAERVQQERAGAERRDQERHQEAERQQQELERELFRQQEERDSQGSKKGSPIAVKKASPKETSPQLPTRKESLKSPKWASPKKSSPKENNLELLSQQRYQPPNARPSTPEPQLSSSHLQPAAPVGAEDKAPSRNEVQSIQVYADEDVYASQESGGGMESLLSSIEQEIDAMEGQRATMVY